MLMACQFPWPSCTHPSFRVDCAKLIQWMHVAQAGVDKAQQCQLLSQCLECWAEVKEEVDEAALRKLEGFIENHTNLRSVSPYQKSTRYIHTSTSPPAGLSGRLILFERSLEEVGIDALKIEFHCKHICFRTASLCWAVKRTCLHLKESSILCRRWSHVIDLVEAGLGRSAAVLLCEHLLFPNVHRSTSVASEGPESKLRDIMLKYASPTFWLVHVCQ